MHQLRQAILFKLLKQLDLNTCHGCKSSIESASELSIEHIRPWEGRDAKLFWDLENIAFSHKRCNEPHRQRGGEAAKARRRTGPNQTYFCGKCRAFKAADGFYRNRSNWHGLPVTAVPVINLLATLGPRNGRLTFPIRIMALRPAVNRKTAGRYRDREPCARSRVVMRSA